MPRSGRPTASSTVGYVAAGKHGLIGFNMPEEFGGGGTDDFRFNAIIDEEIAKAGVPAPALSLHNDVVGPYFKDLTNDEQKQRWLPGITSGETIIAVAMTEPGAGSDLAGIRTSAVRDGDDWIVNGSKTFISSGINCDLVVVVCRTDPEAGHKGFTLLVVERGMEGFTRGRKLDKMGLHAQDTAELHFENVRVPNANLLGKEGRGFYHLMQNLPSERLSIAITAIAGARETWRQTLQYAKDRKAFGQPIGSFQHNRFLLAEMDTELEITEHYIDRCLQGVVDGELSAVEAAKAKWWATETAKKVVDRCVQLHGGYGYMLEYRVARDYVDGRIQTIFGGTTEIMKEIIGRDLGLLAEQRRRAASHQLTAHNDPLNLACALPDPFDAKFTVHPLGDVLAHVAAATEDLHRAVDDSPRHLRAVQLRHGGLPVRASCGRVRRRSIGRPRRASFWPRTTRLRCRQACPPPTGARPAACRPRPVSARTPSSRRRGAAPRLRSAPRPSSARTETSPG